MTLAVVVGENLYELTPCAAANLLLHLVHDQKWHRLAVVLGKQPPPLRRIGIFFQQLVGDIAVRHANHADGIQPVERGTMRRLGKGFRAERQGQSVGFRFRN